jgi:hypothetical protein
LLIRKNKIIKNKYKNNNLPRIPHSCPFFKKKDIVRNKRNIQNKKFLEKRARMGYCG